MQIKRLSFFCYSDISAVFFCAAMKKDGVPFPFEFTENEIPVTNYCRLYIMTILFSLCSLKSLFISA